MVQSDVLLPTYIQVAIVGSITYCLTNDTIFTRVQRYFYLRIGRELHSESIRIVVSGSHPVNRLPRTSAHVALTLMGKSAFASRHFSL